MSSDVSDGFTVGARVCVYVFPCVSSIVMVMWYIQWLIVYFIVSTSIPNVTVQEIHTTVFTVCRLGMEGKFPIPSLF